MAIGWSRLSPGSVSTCTRKRMPATPYCAGFRRPARRSASIISKASRRPNRTSCWTRALGFVLTPAAQQELLQFANSNPALAKYRDALSRGPLAMGLRYQSIRMAKAMLNDAQSVAMMRQMRSTLDYVPRDDAPVPLVNDADVTRLHPAKAPQLKKLVKPLLQSFLGAKEEKIPGGTLKYDGALDGTPVKVRVDYAARDVQMIYSVSIPDPERKVVLIGSGYEHFFGMGGGWDYLTEENAEASVGLLPELLRRIVALRNEIARLL